MNGIEIVETVPRGRRPLLRWLASAVGVLLIVAGVLLLTPLLMVTIVTAVFAISSGEISPPDVRSVLILIGLTVGGLLLWVLGVKLVRGRPRTVLFLRKFGFDDAKQFVSFAASEALGRRWRLVTLDDLETQPISTKPWKRWMIRVGFLILVVGALWLIGQAAETALNPDTSAIDETVDNAVENADNPIGAAIAALLAAVVAAIVVAIATVLGVFFLSVIASVLAMLGIASALTSRSLTRAERDRWSPARSRQELVAFLDRTQEARSKVFAPKISVVRSIDALWKEAVTGLADISDVVLMDISDPSESLLWEVEMLRRRPNTALVLIGAADRIRALQATGGHDPDDRAVLQLLDGQQVLVYSTNQKDFARQLNAMFEAAVRQPATN